MRACGLGALHHDHAELAKVLPLRFALMKLWTDVYKQWMYSYFLSQCGALTLGWVTSAPQCR
jgi:hypothetical protein